MGKHYFATGRGGAGNIRSSDNQPAPHEVDQGSQTPNLLQPIFSTGRGGAGNMHRNTDPQLARKLQDVDADPEDYITPVISGSNGANNNLSIGRGGYGNMISPKNSHKEDQNLQRTKSRPTRNSDGTVNVDKEDKEEKKSGLLSKAKRLFKSK